MQKILQAAHYIIRNYLCYLTFLLLIFYEQYWFAIVYSIGVVINAEVNYVLKNTIQEKRPYNEEFAHMRNIMYGMPSGHSQACFYSTAFIFYIFENIWIQCAYVIFCLFTIILSLEAVTHTFEQMLAGSVVGCTVALFLLFASTFTNRLDIQSTSD
jgi:membrane-associated phospholipid phosphatase